MSRDELIEGLAMIGVIVAWWPLIFLGWASLSYRVALYLGSAVILGIILIRRWARLQEGFRHSERILHQQRLLRDGPRPPLTLQAPPEADEESSDGTQGPPNH